MKRMACSQRNILPPRGIFYCFLPSPSKRSVEVLAAVIFTLVLIGFGAAFQFDFFLLNDFGLVGAGPPWWALGAPGGRWSPLGAAGRLLPDAPPRLGGAQWWGVVYSGRIALCAALLAQHCASQQAGVLVRRR